MELTSAEIVEAAGNIIIESGLDALTIEKLSGRIEVEDEAISSYFKDDADILLFMLHNMEIEIKELINNSGVNVVTAEEEFQQLFRNLYLLFNHKPYYLIIILNIDDKEKGTTDHENLIRIKAIIEKYLLKIINQGKNDQAFKTKRTPGVLVNTILKSFRSFMSHENSINKMIKDLKTLREKPESL
jgi:AcrR family transcriptional regulator